MNTALFYRPRGKWRGAIAFGAAVLIHFAAVGLAGIHQHKEISYATSIDLDPSEPEFIEPDPPADDPNPPPAEVAPLPIPIAPEEAVPEERADPPPVRTKTTRPVTPIQRQRTGTPSSLTLSTAKVLALSAPRPEYPYEARRQKITGDGFVVMTIDPGSGTVTNVSILKSTGSPILDNAASAAFRRWRFKPGAVSQVRCPISFTLTDAGVE